MASVFKRGGRKGKGRYIGSWIDETGKRRETSTGTTDKQEARRIANKWESDAALRREGVIDPTLDAIGKQAARSIESHLTDFENKLKANSRKPQYIRETVNYIREISTSSGFTSADSIDADKVSLFVGTQQDAGKSARTIQAKLTAIKGFTRWLSNQHKLHRDPLSSVKKPNPKTDRKHERRMLLPDEWNCLESYLFEGPSRCGMSSAERSLLYETAIQTGLRSSELRSLTRGQLYLNTKDPYIICKADSTKNSKDARQHITAGLANRLEKHAVTKTTRTPLFGLPHHTSMANMLRDDVADTRAEWVKEAKDDPQEYAQREQSDFLQATNDEGEVLDFHSLRHTCGAWLAKAGVNVKTVQAIMRHQTITITMDTYGHLFPGDAAEAVRKIDSIFNATNSGPGKATEPDAEATTVKFHSA